MNQLMKEARTLMTVRSTNVAHFISAL